MNLLLASNNLALGMDIVAGVLILGFIITGVKNGFVKTFFSAFGGIIALLLAALLAGGTAEFLQGRFGLIDTLTDWVRGVLSNMLGESVMNTPFDRITEGGGASGVIGWLISLAAKSYAQGIPPNMSLNDVVAPVFGYYVTVIICVLGLYILFRLIFYVISQIVKKLHKIKLVGAIDKLLGGAFGLVRGVFIINFALIVIAALPLEFLQNLVTQIDSTVLVSILSKINIYEYILHSIITKISF